VDLTLYAVGASGRVNLGDLAKDVKFFTVSKPSEADAAPEGQLILTPVNVVAASGKRTAAEIDEPYVTDPNSLDTDTPWIGN
jgi:hypothetical protein